jgi:MFS family permease
MTEKGRGSLVLLAIFFIGFGIMADLAVLPGANAMFRSFPDAPAAVLDFILSGPRLFSIVSALLSPLFMKHFSKKRIIIVLYSVFALAGIFGGIVDDVYYIAACRAIVGIARGGLMPTAIALIIELYRTTEKGSAKYVGYFNSFLGFIGILMTVIGGILSAIRWNYAYFEYLAAVPFLIFMVILLPDTPAEKNVQYDREIKKDAGSAGDAGKIPVLRIAVFLFLLVLTSILFGVISYKYSIYVAEIKLGGTIVSAVLGALMAFMAVPAGIFFGAIFGKFERFTVSIGFFLMAVSYFALCFVLGHLWVGLWFGLFGFAYGTKVPFYYSYISMIVPPQKSSLISALVSVTSNVGFFLATFFSTVLQQALQRDTMLGLFPYLAGIAAVAALLSALFCKVSSGKKQRVAA